MCDASITSPCRRNDLLFDIKKTVKTKELILLHVWTNQTQPLWTDVDSACWLALGRCGRSGSVQVSRYSPPVSTQQSAEVPDRLLRRCLRHRRSSATAISTSSPAGCATSSTQYTRLSCFFCRRTNCLELASIQTESRQWRQQLQSVTENTALQSVLVCPAH